MSFTALHLIFFAFDGALHPFFAEYLTLHPKLKHSFSLAFEQTSWKSLKLSKLRLPPPPHGTHLPASQHSSQSSTVAHAQLVPRPHLAPSAGSQLSTFSHFRNSLSFPHFRGLPI